MQDVDDKHVVMERGTARIERGNARTNLVIAALGIASGLLAVVGAVLGVVSSSLNGDVRALNAEVGKLNQQNDQLQAQLTEANASLSSRLDQIGELKQEIVDLQSKLPPSAAVAESAASMRASGTIVLSTNGDKIDLNSTLPNFKLKSSWTYNDSMSYDRGTLRAYGLSSLDLAEGVASYGTCATATGWARVDEIEVHRIQQPNVCFRLGSGRFASIVASSYDENQVTLAISVWEE
ncbi:hypothetical protein ACI2IX_14040 [Leifsonia aquatica]|uniref:hypothetical protein n=1 Tax=Leifsonia aquatica TaxID=144185 RepID=UPI00384C3136